MEDNNTNNTKIIKHLIGAKSKPVPTYAELKKEDKKIKSLTDMKLINTEVDTHTNSHEEGKGIESTKDIKVEDIVKLNENAYSYASTIIEDVYNDTKGVSVNGSQDGQYLQDAIKRNTKSASNAVNNFIYKRPKKKWYNTQKGYKKKLRKFYTENRGEILGSAAGITAAQKGLDDRKAKNITKVVNEGVSGMVYKKIDAREARKLAEKKALAKLYATKAF